ncbi:L,D-transpeptidase [Sulfitobacter sp. S190]|uniref:L,D-transpeptidase family protein n=1 Tax=Sulfitobacter sp. S190 TaxID=2867022 RepID=UPI0021A4AC90|nr:L,D-transpeptidase family protein [Sulfitobacter sp. S190]UWR22247.1 L,D-transpeptidase family protein [Sulfitobacter sp. S190]
MMPYDMVLTPKGVRFMGQMYPCTVGRGGITSSKCEGDGATPRGVHRIVGMLYRPDRIKRPAPWALPIRPGDLWSDDPSDAGYNMMVRAPYPHSHEKLRRADPLYDLIILTDWNWPYAVRGRGSAIFLHQHRRPGFPTEGCVAFSRRDLHRIAPRIRLSTRLIVP